MGKKPGILAQLFMALWNADFSSGETAVTAEFREGTSEHEPDPAHVIRFQQGIPKGLPRKLADYIQVAGVSYRQEAVSAFCLGNNQRITVEREPSNPGHPNSIKVVGSWADSSGQHAEHLGYLPSDAAAEIASTYDSASPIAGTIKVIFLPRPGKSPGVRIDVWGKRRKVKK